MMPDDTIVFCDTGQQGSGAPSNSGAIARTGTLCLVLGRSVGPFRLPSERNVRAPNRPVACFCGDGGFYYHIQELETAVRCGINTVTCVNNNYALGQEMPGFRHGYDGKPGRAMGRAVAILKALTSPKLPRVSGAVGIRVEKPSELRSALDQAFSRGKPAVIEQSPGEIGAVAPDVAPTRGFGWRSLESYDRPVPAATEVRIRPTCRWKGSLLSYSTRPAG